MRKTLLAAISVGCIAHGYTARSQVTTEITPAVTSCNVVTGVATGLDAGICAAKPATCNGIADDRNAFNAINKWARATKTNANGQLLELYVPSGSNCMFLSGQVTNNNVLSGLTKSRLSGYGATFSQPKGSGWSLGPAAAGGGICQRGIADPAGCSARIATVSAGSKSVTLLNTSLCKRFVAGRWAMVSGFDMQNAGYPPNPHYFDFVQIVSTANCAVTGQITLGEPLTNTYLSTWPLYSAGTAVEADQGGPATIYAMGQFWGGESEIRGLTIDGKFATKAIGRKVTFVDVTVTDVTCLWPGENKIITYTNLVAKNCNIEVDKLASDVVFNNLSIRKMHTQSSSVENLVINGATFTDGLYGTPKNAAISNATLPVLQLGPIAYGTPRSAKCTNCVIGNVISGFGNVVKGTLPGFDIGANVAYSVKGGVFTIFDKLNVTGFSDNGAGFVRLDLNTTAGLSNNYTLANNGVLAGPGCRRGCPVTITVTSVINSTQVDSNIPFANFTWTGGGTLTTNASWWAAPGTNLSVSGLSSLAAGVPFFQVTGVTQDSVGTHIATTLRNGYPNVPLSSGKSFMTIQAPKWTCRKCSGTEQAKDFSGAPPDIPIFSYSKRAYTNSTMLENGRLWGKVKSIKINVTKDYTGGTNPFRFAISEQVTTSTGTFSTWAPFINLRQTGLRTITPSGVTCDTGGGPAAGACRGDSGLALPDSEAMFASGLTLSKPDGSPTDQPWAMDYEFVMDQGVVP